MPAQCTYCAVGVDVAPCMHSSYAVVVPNFFARGFAAAAMVTGNLYMAEIFPTGTRAAGPCVCLCVYIYMHACMCARD